MKQRNSNTLHNMKILRAPCAILLSIDNFLLHYHVMYSNLYLLEYISQKGRP